MEQGRAEIRSTYRRTQIRATLYRLLWFSKPLCNLWSLFNGILPPVYWESRSKRGPKTRDTKVVGHNRVRVTKFPFNMWCLWPMLRPWNQTDLMLSHPRKPLITRANSRNKGLQQSIAAMWIRKPGPTGLWAAGAIRNTVVVTCKRG